MIEFRDHAQWTISVCWLILYGRHIDRPSFFRALNRKLHNEHHHRCLAPFDCYFRLIADRTCQVLIQFLICTSFGLDPIAPLSELANGLRDLGVYAYLDFTKIVSPSFPTTSSSAWMSSDSRPNQSLPNAATPCSFICCSCTSKPYFTNVPLEPRTVYRS